jgi:hypothetical protein
MGSRFIFSAFPKSQRIAILGLRERERIDWVCVSSSGMLGERERIDWVCVSSLGMLGEKE